LRSLEKEDAMSKANVNRRKFVMTLGVGSVAAAAATLTGKGEKTGKGVAAGGEGERKGYQVTEHVREYYRTCRV
jgi:hypothetical protein